MGSGPAASASFSGSYSGLRLIVVHEDNGLASVRTAERKIQLDGSTVTLLPSDPAESPTTTLLMDDSNPLLSRALLESLRETFAAVLETQQSSLTVSALLDVRPLYQGEIRVLDFTAPGIIGFAMTLITVMLTAMSVVRERTSGTLTRILIAPVSAWQVTLGYTLAFIAIAVFQTAELFLASVWLFDIRFVGSPGLAALVIVLFAIGLQGIATLISTLSRNEAQAMQFVLFLLIPSILLGGVFSPLETMPASMRPLSYAIPLTYANSALRKVMLTGATLADLAFELSVLAFLALFLSVLSMRRQANTA